MTETVFIVPGPPGAKGRHRTATRDRNGNPLPFPRQHADAKTKKYELLVQQCALAADIERLPRGPVELEITAFKRCPKSDERVRNPRPERRDWGGKDWDNIGKVISDALNKILYHDDRQVSDGIVRKRIAAQGDEPRVIVIARALSEDIES